MARDFNQNRNTNAKLVNATINKYGASYPAQSPWRADGFNKVFVEIEGANPTQKDFLEGNSSVYVYAIGSNINSLLPYSLASFTNIKELYLFSPTMVNIGAIDNDYLTYLTNSDLKVYVPSNTLQSYINTYGGTGKHLENRFDKINDDYPLTVSGSGDLTSQELTNQLMNNYEQVDRTNCTKLVIQGFTNASSVLWGYDFSEILPNLNNNILVNGVKFDFSTFIIQDTTQDHILTASVVSASVGSITNDKLTLIEIIVVPIDFTTYASGSVTELQSFMNTNSIDKLVTTYEAGEMELSLSGDIVAKIVSIGKTLDEALVYARYISVNHIDDTRIQNDNNLIILPPMPSNKRFRGDYYTGGAFRNCINFVYADRVYINTTNLGSIWSPYIAKEFVLENCRYIEYLDLAQNKTKSIVITYGENMQLGTLTITTCGSNNNQIVDKIIINGQIASFKFNNTSIKLSRVVLVDFINGLGTPATQQTLTIGATNLAKLTAEDIAIATQKNWVVQ